MPSTLSPTRIGLRYGVYIGIFFALYVVLTHLLTMRFDMLPAMLALYVMSTGISYGLRDYKTLQEGELSYYTGLGLGMVIAGVAGVISGFVDMLYLRLNPKALQMLHTLMREQLENMPQWNLSAKEVDMYIGIYTPGFFLLYGVVCTLFLGLILSLVQAAIHQGRAE